jgi:hypothetical protein
MAGLSDVWTAQGAPGGMAAAPISKPPLVKTALDTWPTFSSLGGALEQAARKAAPEIQPMAQTAKPADRLLT